MKAPATKAAPLAISEVLDNYLRAFADYYFLTAEQITRRFYQPSTITTVRPRLKALVDAGYLHSFMLPTTKSKSPYIYALSKKGVRFLLEEDSIIVDVYYQPSELQELSHSTLWHTLELNDFLLAAKLLERTTPYWTVAGIWHDLVMRKKPLVIPASYYGQGGKQKSITPDGFLDMRYAHEGERTKRYCFWVELDRGTESAPDAFKDKIRRVVSAVKSGVAQDYFDFKRLSAVVFVTTAGQKRVETMQKWAMQELTSLHAEPELVELFLFAHFSSSMSPHQVFFENIWVTPRKEDSPIALLNE